MLENSNYTAVKARELWETLYLCAKESSNRRFHAPYDKIYRSDILAEIWRRVKRSRGTNNWVNRSPIWRTQLSK